MMEITAKIKPNDIFVIYLNGRLDASTSAEL